MKMEGKRTRQESEKKKAEMNELKEKRELEKKQKY